MKMGSHCWFFPFSKPSLPDSKSLAPYSLKVERFTFISYLWVQLGWHPLSPLLPDPARPPAEQSPSTPGIRPFWGNTPP